HLRLPGPERPRDRDLRGRLPARLPGGRGDGDGLQASPAPRRGARADARARARAVVDHRAALGLLRAQGDAGAARRHGAPLLDSGGVGLVTPLRVSIAASVASLLLLLVLLVLIRSRRLMAL